jgi:hypothetical protein
MDKIAFESDVLLNVTVVLVAVGAASAAEDKIGACAEQPLVANVEDVLVAPILLLAID